MANNVGNLNVELGLGYAKFQSDMGKATQVARRETERMAVTMREQTSSARDSLDLLGDAVGIRLPRELKGVVSQSKLIGPALSAAFNLSAVAAFGAIFADSIIPKIMEATNALGGFGQKVASSYDEMRKLNQSFVDFGTQMKKFANENSLIGLKGSILDREKLNQAKAAINGIADEIARAREEVQRLNQIPTTISVHDRFEGRRNIDNPNDPRKKMVEFAPGRFMTELELANAKVDGLAQGLAKAKAEAENLSKSLKVSLGQEGSSAMQKLTSEIASTSRALRGIADRIYLENANVFEKISFEFDGYISQVKESLAKLPQLRKQFGDLEIQVEAEKNRQILEEMNKQVQNLRLSRPDLGMAMPSIRLNTTELSKFGKVISDVAANMRKSFELSFEGIILGTQTASEAFSRMGRNMVAAIAQVIAKMIAMWAVQKLVGMFFPLGQSIHNPVTLKNPVPLFGGSAAASGAASFSPSASTFSGGASRGESVIINIDARGGEAGIENKIYKVVRQAMQETQNNTLVAQREMSLRRA